MMNQTLLALRLIFVIVAFSLYGENLFNITWSGD